MPFALFIFLTTFSTFSYATLNVESKSPQEILFFNGKPSTTTPLLQDDISYEEGDNTLFGTPPNYYKDRHSLLTCEHYVFDLETSGFGYDARILQITIRKMLNGKQVDSFSTYINPGKDHRISPYAERTHGITQAELENKPYFEDIANTIIHWINGKIVVGHNAISFDANLLKRELERSRGNGQVIFWVKDTLHMARRDWKRQNCTTGKTFTSPKPRRVMAYQGRDLEEMEKEKQEKRKESQLRKNRRNAKARKAITPPSSKREPSRNSKRTGGRASPSFRKRGVCSDNIFGGKKIPSMKLIKVAKRHKIRAIKEAAIIAGIDLSAEDPKELILHRTPADTIYGAAIALRQAAIRKEKSPLTLEIGNIQRKLFT